MTGHALGCGRARETLAPSPHETVMIWLVAAAVLVPLALFIWCLLAIAAGGEARDDLIER